jgi:enoyl-CoA hydratase
VNSTWQLIDLERHDDGVRVITLKDERRHNAIGTQMRDELVECAAGLMDGGARVLVVRGSGRSFCSGADLMEILGGKGHSVDEYQRRFTRVYQSFLSVRSLPIPTIAAVHGHAIGAGLNLALCCDIRLAHPSARFGATFSRLGLSPGGGCTYFLTSALGSQRALSILLNGETFDAEAAVKLGIVLKVHDDPSAAALELAGSIAALPGDLARHIKTAVRVAESQGFDAAYEYECWPQAAAAARGDVWQLLPR